MKEYLEYILNNKKSLVTRLLILIFPIISGGWVILSQYESFTYFNELSKYNINTIFIIFVYIALVPIFFNLLFYLKDTYNLIFNYKGNNKKIKNLNIISFSAIFLIGVLIFLFITLISIKFISFSDIVLFNRYLSLSIFAAFLAIDILTWRTEILEKNEDIDSSKNFDINITFSKESTFLINIPTLLIILLSLIFIYKIEDIEFYKYLIDKNTFLFDTNILVDKEIFELFINGIETGILMTSIVFSQIIFFFIKTKWDYRIYKLNKEKEDE